MTLVERLLLRILHGVDTGWTRGGQTVDWVGGGQEGQLPSPILLISISHSLESLKCQFMQLGSYRQLLWAET